ncbi:MAG TPA: hypothetical protein PLV04_04695 [Phenylobacterium sp.]|nr:hypothetical protein [Phenylobacterium sp.]
MAGPAKQQKPSFFSSANDWIAERSREAARSAHELEAAGRKAWNEATRTGRNVQAATTAQLRALGAQVLAGEQAAKQAVSQGVAAAKAAVGQRPHQNLASERTLQSAPAPSKPFTNLKKPQVVESTRHFEVRDGDLLDKALGRWDSVPAAKPLVGGAAQVLGLVSGAIRGGLHSAEGLAQTAWQGFRLTNPWDQLLSLPGENARSQLIRSELQAADYVADRFKHPEALVQDIRRVAHKARVDLDPAASPEGGTVADEARRRFDIGMNEGELGFNVGTAYAGGPGAKVVGKSARFFRKADSVERYLARGYSAEAAQHLMQPYENGAGSHYLPQWQFREGGPLDGVPFMKAFKDSDWNVSKPEGMTRGQFYDYHFEVDPSYYGAKLPSGVPEKGWSGKRMGLKKRGPLGRFWFGMPAPLKARLLGGAGTFGGTVQSVSEDEDQECP